MGLLEPTHLILIALAVLIFFGPKKIPEFMRGLGKGMGELQEGIAKDGKAALHNAMQDIQHEPMADVTASTPIPEKVATTPVPEPIITADPNAVSKDDKPSKSA